jgi:fatty acid desaturase
VDAAVSYAARGITRCGIWAFLAGGWFLHSLVSVVFFLFLPLQVARRVSPAFHGWRRKDQLNSLVCFTFALAIHLCVFRFLGAHFWALTIGWPLLVFYVYHYRSGYGPKIKEHVLSFRSIAFLRWWLLGFSDHVAHHHEPGLSWYLLAERSDSMSQDQSGKRSVAIGILRQWRGPNIVELPE